MKSGIGQRLISRERVEFDLEKKVKAKLFLDPDVTDYDTLIKDEIKRAIEVVENYTGRAIGPQIRKITYSVLTEETELIYGPFREIVSVSSGGYVDGEGYLTADWSTGGSITFKTGYDNEDGEYQVPAGLLAAVVLAAAEFTGLRPDLKPMGFKAIARQFSVYTWAD